MPVWRHALQQVQVVLVSVLVVQVVAAAVVVMQLVWGLVVEPSRPSLGHWRLPHHHLHH